MTDLFLLIPQSDKNVVRLRFYTGELFNWLAYDNGSKVICHYRHRNGDPSASGMEESNRDHVQLDLTPYLPVISWLLDGLHSGCT